MLRKATIIIAAVSAIAVGILIQQFFGLPIAVAVVCIACGCSARFVSVPWIRLVLLCLVGVGIGMLRVHLYPPTINENHIAYYANQTVTINGRIQIIDQRIDHTKLTVAAFQLHDPQEMNISGLVLMKTSLFPEYEVGDVVSAACRLRKPEPIEDFQYDRYLARYGVYVTCSQPKLKVVQHDPAWWQRALTFTQQHVGRVINQTVPEPAASLLAGILLGSRKGIPADITEAFTRTGITHIVAVSGYNISIVATVMLQLFISIGINRKRAFWGMLAGILFFVLLTGASAAVVRAGIMGVIALLAKQTGRQSQIGVVLALTAGVMVLINPTIIRDDVGFQLSFLATVGLVYISPLIKPWVRWLPEKFAIQDNMATTLAANLITTPIILYQFGRFSIIAPLVNVVVLPFIPLIMLVGFMQVVAGLLWLPLGQVVGWATWLLVQGIVVFVQWASALSWAAVLWKIGVGGMVMAYVGIVGGAAWVGKKGHIKGMEK